MAENSNNYHYYSSPSDSESLYSTASTFLLEDNKSNATNSSAYYDGYYSYGSDANDDDDYYDGQTSILAKLAALLWMLTLIFWVYLHNKSEEDRQRRLERRRLRRAEKANRKKLLEPETRKCVISATIRTRKMTQDEEQQRSSQAILKRSSLDNTTKPPDYNTNDDYDEMTCTVCLERFEVGEELSWSKDLKCLHIFHSECLIPWLMKHDDCPCCRTSLFNESDFENVIGRMNNPLDDDSEDDDWDDIDGSGGAFRIVNGLVSIVRNSGRSILQLSPSRRSNDDHEYEQDGNGLHSSRSLDLDMVIGGYNSTGLEMTSAVRRVHSSDDSLLGSPTRLEIARRGNNSDEDDLYIGHYRDNTGERRKKKRGKKYNSLALGEQVHNGEEKEEKEENYNDFDEEQ
mmetsp:Transcript_15865/g.19349  ORF Transcript_15865/g.19349 Transcript_15865/m.19349 type:complete len:401 (+) Transcript_15865:187-1389(+)